MVRGKVEPIPSELGIAVKMSFPHFISSPALYLSISFWVLMVPSTNVALGIRDGLSSYYSCTHLECLNAALWARTPCPIREEVRTGKNMPGAGK